MVTSITGVRGGAGVQALQDVGKDGAREVLQELKIQLQGPSGRSKSGVLRLMYASAGKANEQRTLSFERKSWYQPSRWGQDSSKRTRQALQTLLSQADLPPQASEALENYFSTHKRISSSSLGRLLDQYLPVVAEPLDSTDSAELVNARMREAQIELATPPNSRNQVHLSNVGGRALDFRVANQFMRDVHTRGGLSLQGDELVCLSANPGQSNAEKWQALGDFLGQINGADYSWQHDKLQNVCFNLSSMVGQFILRDFSAGIEPVAREAAMAHRPELAADLAKAHATNNRSASMDENRLAMSTRMHFYKSQDGANYLSVSYRLSGPLSYTAIAEDASPQRLSTGLFVDEQRSLTLPLHELLSEKAKFPPNFQLEQGLREIRPLPPRQMALIDRMEDLGMNKTAESWLHQGSHLQRLLDPFSGPEREILHKQLLSQPASGLKLMQGALDNGAFNQNLSLQQRAAIIDPLVDKEIKLRMNTWMAEKSGRETDLDAQQAMNRQMRQELAAVRDSLIDDQNLPLIARFATMFKAQNMTPETTHAVAIAMQSRPDLAQPDAPIMRLLRNLYGGQPMTGNELEQIEQMIAQS